MTNKEEMLKNKELIKQAYATFNVRNIEGILQIMHPQVKWLKAWEGNYANGHAEVNVYWQRQWKEIDPKVTPENYFS